MRKEKLAELENTLKKELEKRGKLEDDLNGKLNNEKDKSRDERDKRVKVNKENKKILVENKTLNDQLKGARVEWIDLNSKKNELEANWEKEKTKYVNKINEQ